VKAGITRFGTTHDAINVKAQDEAKARKIIEREVKKMDLNLNLKTKTPDAPAPIAIPTAQDDVAARVEHLLRSIEALDAQDYINPDELLENYTLQKPILSDVEAFFVE
jgi:hypothetical protein